MKKLACLSVALLLLAGCGNTAAPKTSPTAPPAPEAGIYTPGTYAGTGAGFGGNLTVSVEVDAAKILKVEITEQSETEGVGSKAVEALPEAILAAQGTEVEAISGATISSEAIRAAANYALALARGEDAEALKPEVVSTGVLINLDTINTTVAGLDTDEKGETTYDKGWTVQPKPGITKGDYFKREELFRQGHVSTLEVVVNGEQIELVEFNELTRPNYYTKFFAGVPKRMSEYNFDMGEKEGAAWIQGILLAEQEMMEHQDLNYEVDLVSGASISVKNSLVPMAAKIAEDIPKGTTQKYYSIAKVLGGGLTGKLDVVLDNGVITECRYDEIFADSPDEIENPTLKKYYRQSKYQSVMYVDPCRVGFAFIFDALNEHVVASQDMFDIANMPSVGEGGDFATTGFTTRNTAWDNYLSLAEELHAEMVKDGVLS